MKETHRMEIQVKAEVEKKRLDIERELGGLGGKALEERQQAFWEKNGVWEGRQWGATLDGVPDFYQDN